MRKNRKCFSAKRVITEHNDLVERIMKSRRDTLSKVCLVLTSQKKERRLT